MMRFSRTLGLAHWTAIWLRYMSEALHACSGRPLALVSHAQLTQQPARHAIEQHPGLQPRRQL